MADQSKLDIKISTTADTSGVESTTDAFQKLDTTASKTSNTIQASLQKTEIAEKSRSDSEREANQDRAQSALKQIASAEKTAQQAEATAKGFREVGKATKELSKLGEEAGRVMQGLSEGGLGGLARAGTGAGNIIRTLASGALGGVLIPVVAAAGAGLLVLRSIAEQNEKDIKRIFDSHAKASKLYQDRLAELTAASKRDFDAQVVEIKKLAAAYDEVTASIDKAYARQQKLDTANESLKNAQTDTAEKRELGSARTPEQQEAIKQKYSNQRVAADTKQKFNQFDTVDLRAKIDTQNAQDALSAAQQKQRDLEASAADADKLASEKQAVVERFNKNPELNGSRVHGDGIFQPISAPNPELVAASEAAKKDALATRDAAKAANDLAQKAAEELAATIKKTSETIQSAQDSVEENGINRNAFRQSLTGKQLDTQASTKDLQKQLGEKTAALQPGDDAGIKEIQSLRAQIAAQKSTGNIYGNALNQDTANRSTAGVQADQRAAAGLGPPKVGGADGGTASITKDGETIKITSASTVAELKKTSTAFAESSKAIEKQTPLLTKSASENAAAIAKYHASVLGAFQATTAKINSQAEQIEQLRREIRAKADHS